MKRSKQTPVFMVSEEFAGLKPNRYTTSTYLKNEKFDNGGKITCLPLNRQAFRIAMSIEGMTEKIGVFGHNFFNKKEDALTLPNGSSIRVRGKEKVER